MFLGYATLSDVEIWNNQRVLDYLSGNPDLGIPAMASPYTRVNRSSAPATATQLFCDLPVRTGNFIVSMAAAGVQDGAAPNGYAAYRYVQSASLLDEPVEIELINNGALHQIRRFNFTHAEAGGGRPPVPALNDPGWVDVGIPAIPMALVDGSLPTIPNPCTDVTYAPHYEHWTVRPMGHSITIEFWIYIDYCLAFNGSTGSGVSLDSGAVGTWSTTASSTLVTTGADPHGRYTTPAQDDAPWFDPNVPESAEFAGLYVEEITGFDSIAVRTVTESVLMGATLGPLMMKGRPLTVTGWLRASTCCAAEYGLRWLAEALAGRTACDGCPVGDLTMLKCAPPASDLFPNPLDYIRIMHQVGLVDGPKVVDRAGSCCASCGATSLKVQFTITSELPYIFSDAEWVVFDEPITEGPFDYDLTLPCVRGANCPEPVPFVANCGLPLSPPPPPFKITDECYCEPWESLRLGAQFINSFQWNSATSYIELHAGSGPLRNFKLVAFQNPRNEDIPLDFEVSDRWMCVEPCASIAVSNIPSGSTLVIDSRTRRVQLLLAGGQSVPGLQFLSSGDGGTPFDWFDVGNCTRLSLVASVESTVAEDATVSVGLVNRYLASGG